MVTDCFKKVYHFFVARRCKDCPYIDLVHVYGKIPCIHVLVLHVGRGPLRTRHYKQSCSMVFS